MDASACKHTILVFDDEKNIRKSIEIALTAEGYQVLLAHEPGLALKILSKQVIDLLILDIRLENLDGISFFKKIRKEGHLVPTIFISGHASLSEAAQAVQVGGFDFIEKPFKVEKLNIVVKRCLEHEALKDKIISLKENLPFQELIGESRGAKKVKAEALKVATTSASALITGESGTGKELVANIIHSHSSRKDAPFIKVNCSAIPETLVESELFGHEKGAFTGADSARRGFFERAHRGTIFLDEIGDLSLSAQAKVLRVLQSGEIQKVGSEKTLKIDARVISGTHKDLKKAALNGEFREDLLYRLNVVPIEVPSLRERIDDIPLLVEYFRHQLCAKHNIRSKSIDSDVVEAMKHYSWPGNIRELNNVLERMMVFSDANITFADLPEEIQSIQESTQGIMEKYTLRDFRNSAERTFILTVLKRLQGNITQAAQELGVARTYLHKRIAQLNIVRKDYFE